jgi:hypothetical protein
MEEERIWIRAIKFAEAYYEGLGWTVENVARVRGDHAGYDLFLEKDSERMTVEVKGCSRLYQIPDLYDTEINRETKQLIADELCVVYYVFQGHAPQVARIPRAAILPEFIVPKYGYRISGRFKNETDNQKVRR